MRLLALFLIAALASCSQPDPDNRSETANMVAAGDTAPIARPPAASGAPAQPSANETDAAPVTVDAIPAAFHGRYDESPEACTRPSEYRLQVSGTKLRFHESIGTVASVTVEDKHTISVTADYEGEGEKWRGVRQLGLSEDGARLTISGDGTRLVRIRCP